MPPWSKERDVKNFLAGTHCYSKPFVGTSQQNTSVWYEIKRSAHRFIYSGWRFAVQNGMYVCVYAFMPLHAGRWGSECCLQGFLLPLGKSSVLKRTRSLPLPPGRALPSPPPLPGNIISDAAHVRRTLITTFCFRLCILLRNHEVFSSERGFPWKDASAHSQPRGAGRADGLHAPARLRPHSTWRRQAWCGQGGAQGSQLSPSTSATHSITALNPQSPKSESH